MTITGEFRIPVSDFPLEAALTSVSNADVRLVRVTMAPGVLSPFFWVSASDLDAFDEALAADQSVAEADLLDGFQGAALYRVEWETETVALASVVADFDGSVLSTVATAAGWDCRVRFPDRDALAQFRDQLADADVDYETRKLTTGEQSPGGPLYGLTAKQTAAVSRAWVMGYYETPREVTLDDVASDLGISQQALSDRLRRAHANLLRNTVAGAAPIDR